MGAEDYVPGDATSITNLRKAAIDCKGCDLFREATQTVFGEGRDRRPGLMLIGEQPGDAEDRAGVPFVGPAGAVLDKALGDLGLERRDLYVTNAVKHFKWQPKGALRLHKSPSAREIAACRPWLTAEILATRPKVIVCLGAIATRALLGPSFRLTQHRGQFVEGPQGTPVLATVHPALIVRLRDAEERQAERARFTEEIGLAARRAARSN